MFACIELIVYRLEFYLRGAFNNIFIHKAAFSYFTPSVLQIYHDPEQDKALKMN